MFAACSQLCLHILIIFLGDRVEIESGDTHAEQQGRHDARHKTDTLHRTLVLDGHAAGLIAKGRDDQTCHSATKTHADLQGYHDDFYKLFGFGINGVDYDADIDPDVKIPSIAE